MRSRDIVLDGFYTLRDGTLVRVVERRKASVGYGFKFRVFEQTGDSYFVASAEISAVAKDPKA